MLYLKTGLTIQGRCKSRPTPKGAKGGGMNAINRINFMHDKFGKVDGKCKDCPNFKRWWCGNKIVRKCKVYGVTHSIATDWNAGFDACGLFGQEKGQGKLYLENRERRKQYYAEIEGQQSLFGGEI